MSLIAIRLPDYCKCQEICNKAVDSCPSAYDSVPDQYMTQEMCDKVVSKESFMLKCRPDECKTQNMSDIAVDSYLLASKLILD